jgi:O-antigen ligase
VNNATSAPWPPGATGQRWFFHALLALGAVATVAATIIGNGNIAVAAAPALGLAALGVLLIAPLRLPLFVLILLCLGLDATAEGTWDSPLAPLGRLLVHNLAKTIEGANLPFQLFAAVFVLLLFIHWYRRLSGSRIDSLAYRGVAKPLSLALVCSLVAVFAEFANGVLHGGDMQMAKIQIQTFVFTMMLAYLLSVALRGIQDYKVIGRLILAAACMKAVLAIYVYKEIMPTLVPSAEVATTHGDSMLFTTAAMLLISRFYEQPNRRNLILTAGFLPLMVWAMIANNRRTAWVEIAASIITLYIISHRTKLKRLITQTLVLSVPVVIGYIAVGWNSSSRIFAPIKTFRSVGDGQVDPSTLYRDLENFNLIQMLKEHTLLGSGFGQPYKIVVIMPDISFFQEWRFMPHNSVLGLWAFTGWLGFTGLSMAAVAAVYFAARAYRAAQQPVERTAAFMSIAAIVIYWVQCWADIGFSERTGIFLIGPAIAIAARMVVSTGAWSPWREATE